MKVNFDYKLILKILVFIASCILGFFFFKYLIVYFLPFILAVLVTFLIEPIVSFFEKKMRLSRGLSVGLVMALLLVLFGIFLIAGVSQIYVELEKLSRNLPSYQILWEKYQWILNQNEELKKILGGLQLSATQLEAVNKILQDLYVFFADNSKIFISELLGLLTKLPSLITLFMISFIATFFVSRDRRMISNILWRIVPESQLKKVRFVKKELTMSALGFIRAEFILISITTIISIIGLEILNSDYALILGFASGLLDLIPVIGPSLIFIPWAIFSLISGNVLYGVGLLILYGVMVVIRQVAEARIIGKSIGVHPLATLIAMYAGVKIFGVTGFIIGPAVVVVLKALSKAGIITVFTGEREE